ncbi:hypothetical protein Leryth_024920 [Lithospermum erythrorhizon]|nr:hypothetical protein Leryth_024920 [Lithospermum erythrorhizon]
MNMLKKKENGKYPSPKGAEAAFADITTRGFLERGRLHSLVSSFECSIVVKDRVDCDFIAAKSFVAP